MTGLPHKSGVVMSYEDWHWLYRDWSILDVREATTKKAIEAEVAEQPVYPYDAPALGVDSHTRMTRAREFEMEEL
jgi:hypothetical protein